MERFNQNKEKLRGPVDLALTFPSPFDGSQQPYRLYLPSAYDGQQALPLLVLLHGTGGDQTKYFDAETYRNGIYRTEAEQRGMVLLCPLGTDRNGLPTEWRGEAEINVLGAIADVQARFRIDPERIVCSGQSMGGTGTTYLCCRYPDLFAAGVPLASEYGHLSLLTNLRYTPMFYVQGANDWPVYAATGPIPITQELKRLGYGVELWMVPNAEHNTMDVSTPRVIEWALPQKRVAHPRHITHRAYFPSHGRAWWVEILTFERPGWFAEVDARAETGNRIVVKTKNTTSLVLRPDPVMYDSQQTLAIQIEGNETFHGLCGIEEQILLERHESGWKATVTPRQARSRTAWQDCVIGVVDDPPTWEGGPETTLGNWLTDAMRDISGADIAICTKGHFRIGTKMRGAAIHAGQTLHFVELANWLRPCDGALAEFTLKGADLLQIIEMNLLDGEKDDMFLVQVSGCHYRFDRSKPQGSRIIETDLVADHKYRIVCNSSIITRTDTLHLGPYYGQLNPLTLEPNLLSAAWSYAVGQQGHISAKLEGRIAER